MRKRAIIFFTRVPVEGQVKTRLAQSIGDSEALYWQSDFIQRITREIYSLWMAEQRKMDSGEISFYVFHTSDAEVGLLSNVMKKAVVWKKDADKFLRQLIFVEQRGEMLWEKMSYALAHSFERGAEGAILFGSDVPELSAEMLEGALILLDTDDAVLSPTADGGYYLIGMRELIPQAFEKIGDKVFESTRAAVEQAGKTCAIGPRLHDIDTLDDLNGYFLRIRGEDEYCDKG